MAMLRRLDGPVCAARANGVHEFPEFASRASDWSLQSLRIDTDRHTENLRSQRLEREAKVAQNLRCQEEQAAMQADHQMQLAHADELKQALAGEMEQRCRQDARRDVQIQQAKTTSMDMRLLQQRCLNQQASAERNLQLLRDMVIEKEACQRDAAENHSEKLVRLRMEEKAVGLEVAKRAAGQELLRTLSAQAASGRTKELARKNTELQQDRAHADQVAARVRDEDLQLLASRQRAQVKLHAALDGLVEERKSQYSKEAALDLEQDRQASEYNDRKRAFAKKLASERVAVEDSRQSVLRDLALALHTKQLQAHVVEELCEVIRYEELQVKERQDNELRLRDKLQRRMACVHAYQESISRLEERRLAMIEEDRLERQELLQKKSEDERLEQLGQQQRRMKQLSHAREIDRSLADRRQRQDLESRHELEQLQAQKQEEEREASIIEQERRRLLHAYGLYNPADQLRRLLEATEIEAAAGSRERRLFLREHG